MAEFWNPQAVTPAPFGMLFSERTRVRASATGCRSASEVARRLAAPCATSLAMASSVSAAARASSMSRQVRCWIDALISANRPTAARASC